MANYWCYGHRGPWRVLNSDWETGGEKKFGTGAYWLYMLMNRAYAPEVQPMTVDHGRRKSSAGDYAYTVSAAMFRDSRSGRQAVVAVNRSESQAFRLALSANARGMKNMTRLVVTGESLKATNVSATPDAVTLREDQNWGRQVGAGRIELDLPARSVTAWIWE